LTAGLASGGLYTIHLDAELKKMEAEAARDQARLKLEFERTKDQLRREAAQQIVDYYTKQLDQFKKRIEQLSAIIQAYQHALQMTIAIAQAREVDLAKLEYAKDLSDQIKVISDTAQSNTELYGSLQNACKENNVLACVQVQIIEDASKLSEKLTPLLESMQSNLISDLAHSLNEIIRQLKSFKAQEVKRQSYAQTQINAYSLHTKENKSQP
jgi:Mg2+ and Co2+ transporter CorA